MQSTNNSNKIIGASELILRDDGSLYHLGILPEDVGDRVVIVGDPERVPLVSAHFDSVRKKISNREFVTHSGELGGKSITVISSGIGVDNMDIVLNELDAAVNIDLETRRVKPQLRSLEIVRIGTSGGLHEDISVGSFVASTFAFGWDGIPWHYHFEMNDVEQQLADAIETIKPIKQTAVTYAATADEKLLERIGHDMTQGITATMNSFYGGQGRVLRIPLRNASKKHQMISNFRFQDQRITNYEMETSGLYCLSKMMGHRALTVCAILANRERKEFHNQPSVPVESLVRLVLERF